MNLFFQQKVNNEDSEKRNFETFSSTDQNTRNSNPFKIEDIEETVKTETFLEEDSPLEMSLKV